LFFSYLHSCSPPIIHGNLTCDTIFIQHNGLVKIGSGKVPHERNMPCKGTYTKKKKLYIIYIYIYIYIYKDNTFIVLRTYILYTIIMEGDDNCYDTKHDGLKKKNLFTVPMF
jgi:hypothetical protein